MNEEALARSIAILCASMLEASEGNPRDKDRHVKVIAMADNYLDFILPYSLKVSRQGEVSFEPD